MIISYPTGLYSGVIPSAPGDKGNVTFLISNTTPPRTNLVFPKVPAGLVERGRQLPAPVDPLTNRQYLGDLIYSVSSSQRSITGNSSRQFEIGQILEFGSSDTTAVDPMLVNPVTETRHNTNVFDYDALGVSDDEQALIAQESLKIYSALTAQLNQLKQQRADAETEINIQQKLINETARTILALQVVAQTSPDVADLVKKLQQKQLVAITARDVAIAAANTYANQSEITLMQLRAVAAVVK